MAATVAGIRLILDDGADLTDKVNPRLLELTLSEKRGGEADELSITLHNHDGQLIAPEKGRVLALQLGWQSGDDVPVGLVDKGRFKVDEVEESGPPDIVILRARSADFTGDYRKRRTQSWRATTLDALIDRIAARNGLSARVHPALAGKAIVAIEQHNKSDMAFVKDLGSRYDALATWKDRKLIFMPVGSTTTASGRTIPTTTIRRTDGWTWNFGHAERDEVDGAEAQWHDGAAGRRRTVKRGGKNRKRLKRVYASEAEATQAAEAAASRGRRGARTFSYDLALALPALQPNGRVTLTGWNPRIDGLAWLVESVETTMGKDGLKQQLTLESA
ncbi:MAG: late control protein [Alphaproteobacteria bacterium HGW-Alphaproteobacteria-16]|nr:MAG: late control protein [Alphaproteobacteria bacterium HGW-Alphaproteobacteria-16]